MNSTTSSRKQIEKVSSDDQVIGFDLFSQITYMAILSRGGVTRDRLLEYCGRQRYLTSVFFEYINLMARSMGVEYTRAFQAVAQRAKAPGLRACCYGFQRLYHLVVQSLILFFRRRELKLNVTATTMSET